MSAALVQRIIALKLASKINVAHTQIVRRRAILLMFVREIGERKKERERKK